MWTVLYMCIEYHIQVNMYHVSAQGVDERMINVHYYYYYLNLRHVSEVPTPDYSPRGVRGLVNWDLDWSVNKSVCSEQVLGLGPFAALHQEGAISVFRCSPGFRQLPENPSELQTEITFAEGDLHSPTRLSKTSASWFHFSWASHCRNPYPSRHPVLLFWTCVLLPLYVK